MIGRRLLIENPATYDRVRRSPQQKSSEESDESEESSESVESEEDEDGSGEMVER